MMITMTHYRAKGTVLVLSLLILLVLTIVGVASMTNVLMQERMAGNVNLQSLAFEAASAGIGEALDHGMVELASRPCPDSGNQWSGTSSDWTTLDLPDDSAQGVVMRFSLRTDCLQLPQLIDTADGTISVPRFESYVTSRGEAVNDSGDLLAAREIEVRIDSFRRDGLSAMRVEGTAEIVFEAGNSNSFVMDGQGGAAISTSTPENSAIISEDLAEKDRVQNFVGGVGTSTYPPPFNDGAEMAKFVSRVRAYMEHFQSRGVPLPVCEHPTDPSLNLPMRFVNGNLALGGSDTFHGITYVTGNVSMGGNPRGSGLLIAEGTIQWRGTADFTGMAINLGGVFTMSGGGTGETTGMIYNANLNLDSIRPSGSGPVGDYLLYNSPAASGDFNWGSPISDPWFDAQVVNNGGVIELYNPLVHDPLIALGTLAPPELIPGIVSKLETNFSVPAFTSGNNRGLAYHRLYSGCGHNDSGGGSWLNGLDANGAGAHSCKGTDDGFGTTSIIFDGGGGHSMTYDCHATNDIRLALENCPLPSPCPNPYDFTCVAPDWEQPLCDADDPQLRKNCPLSHPWPDPQCDIPGRGGKTEAIISWRENIGWREALGN